ncbi:hypothetical protein ACJJTC_016900 [Scirpophaga incertulas]
MNVRRLDALCVTELSKGSHTEELRVGIMALWSGVQQDEYASAGVGVVLSSRLGSGMKDYGLVGPKLLWVRIKLGITRVFLLAGHVDMLNETKALVKEKRISMILKEEERLTRDFEANSKLFWREVK